jgi:hypothetical protein
MKRVVIGIVALGMFAACDSSNGTDNSPGIDVPADIVADTPLADNPATPDVEDRDPGAVDPGVSDPGPTDPGAVDPGPTDPGAVDPGPTDPGTVDPGVTDPGPTGPAGHTEDNGGVLHKPGKNDPLKNCTTCHGATLRGGVGPSCFDCHNNNDHTSNRSGAMHLGGSTSTCVNCHGPKSGSSAKSSTGGIGPACSMCH